MSRVGLKTITIPEGVNVNLTDHTMTVKGPKGELTKNLSELMEININDNEINVVRPNDLKETRSLHGTTRSLIANMITGVTTGFQKELEITGVGYRATLQGNKLVIGAGYSHPVEFEQEDNIEFEVPKNSEIIIKGIEKERVGAIASVIRAVRPPEPYKGKGIHYKGEIIRRKEGKTAK